jgi:hypothetical protein
MKKLILILGCTLASLSTFGQADIAGFFGHQRTAVRFCGWSPGTGSVAGSFDLRNDFVNQPINFFAGGATPAFQRMTILGTNGNVGIGITLPVQKLVVANGNIDANTANTGYMINNTMTLWRGSAGNMDNIFVGAGAGAFSTGTNNTFCGANSGAVSTSGNNNTFLGWGSGLNNDGASDNTFIGNRSGLSTIGVGSIQNTFVGSHLI